MNEKYIEYYNVQNDKSLIEKKMPTEKDIEKFDKWKAIKREDLKMSCILITISLLVITVTGIISKNLFLIILTFIFSLIEFYIVKDYLSSKTWKLEYCDYGNIVDKFEKKDGKEKDYYVIVKINKNSLKYKLKLKEFLLLNISDNVVVFAIDSKKETFIVKNN